MNKPLIGITTATLPDTISPTTPFHAVRKSYIHLIEKSGGVPLILASSDSEKILDAYAKLCDGLLIPGGGDIHPSLYNRKKETKTGKYHMKIDTLRDKTELYLFKKMVELKKPVIGICRGCQMINIALGGTLIQDVQTAHPEMKEIHLDLSDKDAIFAPRHAVTVDTSSRLYTITKTRSDKVNSAHHQIIDEIGKNLAVCARSEEGIVEAIESTNGSFVFGLQWHPEMLLDDMLTQQLFAQFIQTARSHSHTV